MNIDENGLRLITKHEGYRSCPYRDPVGVLTIGYGHTGYDATKGECISKERARELLLRDVEDAERYVNSFGVDLKQDQFNALVSLAFNVGNFGQRLRSALKEKRFREVPEIIKLYNKAGGRVLPGLVKRREDEALLFQGATNPAAKKLFIAGLALLFT